MNEVSQPSFLQWVFFALGPMYGLLLPATAVLIFVGACLVVAMNRRPGVIAAYLAFLPAPLLLGIIGAFHGMIASFQVIAMSPAAPKPAEMAEGISTALICPLVAILATLPAYFVTSVGLFLRTVTYKDPLTK